MKNNRKKETLLLLFFFFSFLIAFISGRFEINWTGILASIKEQDTTFSILFNLRLPRIILGMAVGAGLSMAGLLFQQIFKNPIASPDILGVSSGASFGAALAMVLSINIPGIVQISSFFFGFLAVMMAYTIKKVTKSDNILYLVLAGIIISAFFSALLAGVKYLADPYTELPSIIFWSMGGLFRFSWNKAIFSFSIVLVIGWIFHKSSYKLGILSTDDQLASTMGIDVWKWRNAVLALASLMVSILVSIAGTIGWIALISPHIARIIFKNHKNLYLYTGLIGASSLILLDTVARSITSSELPLGILTALIGAPVLGYLIVYKKTI